MYYIINYYNYIKVFNAQSAIHTTFTAVTSLVSFGQLLRTTQIRVKNDFMSKS